MMLLPALIMLNGSFAMNDIPPPQLPYTPDPVVVDALETYAAPIDSEEFSSLPLSALETEAAEAPWIAAKDEKGLALDGLDPITFFEGNAPRPGSQQFKAEYHGAVFLFESRDHLEQFLKSPEQFAPAYGGYDPEALSRGLLQPASVDEWIVHNNRLYLNGSPKQADKFEEGAPEMIRIADEKWRHADTLFRDQFFKAHTR